MDEDKLMVETSTTMERQVSAPSTLNSSVKFGMISLLAYGFSFGKSLVVARYFGTSTEMDAYTMAFLVPNMLVTLLTIGLPISLVPALAAAEWKGEGERANTFRAGLLLFTGVATVTAVLLAIFSPATMAMVAPGFDASKQRLAAGLLRWCAALLPLNAVYAYCSAELLSRRKYVAVAGAPIISTLISVAALLEFASLGANVLAVGLVAGTLVQAAAVALPAWIANRLGARIRWWTPEVKRLMREQAPLLVISSFGVVNVSVDQFMAGLLPSGSAAALSFANSLSGVVIQTVVMAASWVLLPELSKLAAEADHEGLRLKMQQGISGIAMVAIPAAVAIFVLGGTAIHVLFQHGRFDSQSTQQVSSIWMGYTCGLVPFALGMVPLRLFNAMRQNQFLVQLGMIAASINAGLDYALMRWLGPVGISLSTSLVYVCSCILIFRFVRKLVPGIVDGKLWAGILRAVLVSLPAGAALWLFRQTFSGITAVAAGGLLFMAIIYAAYLWLGLVDVPFKKLRAVLVQ